MPRPCTICTHLDRAAIDAALVSGTPYRNIAERYGVSMAALSRHNAEHLPATMVMSKEAEEVAHADNLMARLDALTEEAHRIGGKAEKTGDYRTALAGVRELVRIVEVQAKIVGEIDTGPTVNVLIDQRVQTVILDALGPYPAARIAVADALGNLSDG